MSADKLGYNKSTTLVQSSQVNKVVLFRKIKPEIVHKICSSLTKTKSCYVTSLFSCFD